MRLCRTPYGHRTICTRGPTPRCAETPGLTSLSAWLGQTNCIGHGDCAFCAYAHGWSPGTEVPCGKGCVPLIAEMADAGQMVGTVTDDVAGAVFFWNPKAPLKDWLAIFADYGVGRNNAKFMDSQNLEYALLTLFSSPITTSGGNNPNIVALHQPKWASVAWTHAHFFSTKDYPTFSSGEGEGPDGLTRDTTYWSFYDPKDPNNPAKDVAAMILDARGS